jgi:hypothetical protein
MEDYDYRVTIGVDAYTEREIYLSVNGNQ